MSKIYIGIDPGVTGALGVIFPDTWKNKVIDMPTISVANGRRKESRAWGKALFDIIDMIDMKRNDVPVMAIIERTHPMKDSAMTAFSMGMSLIAAIDAVEIACIPYIMVNPSAWKKHFKLTKCDKDASRTLAIQRFPELTDQLKLKKHHNRAEALLLALYGKEAGL
jgi:crossover junction endodeoxyribonuclease RuvC